MADDNKATENSQMTDLVRLLLEQNRLCEQQMEMIITRLTDSHKLTVTAPLMLPNLAKRILMFNGETGDTDEAAEWLSALRTAARLNNWPDSSTLEAGRSYLEGAAKQWYLSHMTELDTFDKFATSFEHMFTCQESVTEIWRKMYDRVQQKDETVFSYFHDKVRMCRRLKLNETETKKMICVGLYSRDLSSAIMSNGYLREEELLSDIRTFTEVNAIRNERFRGTPVLVKRSHVGKADGGPKIGASQLTIEKGTSTKSDVRQFNGGPRCFNCQQTGHISRDCAQPRRPLKCSLCKMDGHSAKHCKGASIPQVSLVSNQSKPDMKYYIKEVYINAREVPIRGLVDTGSAFSIIKKSIAEKYELVVESKITDMHVYGRAQSVKSHGVIQATVQIDQVSEIITLVVVDNQIQPYDIIVGRTFTDCHNVTFIKTKDQLWFAYGMTLPYQDTEVPVEVDRKTKLNIVQ